MRRPLWLLPAVGMLGCSPHTVKHDPTPPIKLATQYATRAATTATTQSEAKASERWWESFGDASLSALVDRALEQNFDLHAAWARVVQARAGADMAGAPRWPTLEASASGNRREFQAFGGQSVPGQPRTRRQTFLNASLAASYEVDLWDRIGSGQRAAVLDQAAAIDGAHAIAMTLSSEVAETWFNLVQARKRGVLLTEQLEVNEQFHRLLELRFQNGQATIVDVNQQAQQAVATRGQLALQESAAEVLQHRLSILLGQAPGPLPTPGEAAPIAELPMPPALPSLGVPSELLKRRPDLRAAQRRVEAADERIAVAVAARYPSLRLTGTVGVEPSQPNNWFMQPLWSLLGNLTAPIIDGGRRAAEVERTRGVLAERVADYGKAVLTAVVEVEVALSQERQQHLYLAEVTQQAEIAEATLAQARERYGQGQSDFLTVLTTLRTHQQTQLTLLDAQRQLLSYRIQLCRALGGTWTDSLREPSAEEDS